MGAFQFGMDPIWDGWAVFAGAGAGSESIPQGCLTYEQPKHLDHSPEGLVLAQSGKTPRIQELASDTLGQREVQHCPSQ